MRLLCALSAAQATASMWQQVLLWCALLVAVSVRQRVSDVSAHHVLLQGGVPLPVYNTVHMMMPMNLQVRERVQGMMVASVFRG